MLLFYNKTYTISCLPFVSHIDEEHSGDLSYMQWCITDRVTTYLMVFSFLLLRFNIYIYIFFWENSDTQNNKKTTNCIISIIKIRIYSDYFSFFDLRENISKKWGISDTMLLVKSFSYWPFLINVSIVIYFWRQQERDISM